MKENVIYFEVRNVRRSQFSGREYAMMCYLYGDMERILLKVSRNISMIRKKGSFIIDDEENGRLPMLGLDVLRKDDGFITKVCRKTTLTQKHVHWRLNHHK